MTSSSLATQFNQRSPAVKRLMKEAAELAEPTEDYYAQPLEYNLFEWHFTVRGPPDTDFARGYYHGRIILPTEYPMKPPSIILLTPNGRFEVNKKICLSISGHHPESWQPSWSIRTALLAIIGFMPTESRGAIGGLDYTPEERQALAIKSQSWSCPSCGSVKNLLKDQTENPELSSDNQEAKELAKQIRFKVIHNSHYHLAPIKDFKSNTLASLKESDPGSSNKVEPQESKQELPENAEKDDSNVNKNSEARRRRIGVVYNEHSPRENNQTAPSISSNNSYEATVQSSQTRSSTYLIVILTLTIAFLLFRRIFLTDSN